MADTRKNYPRVKEWRYRNPEKHRATQKRTFERKAAIVRAAKAVPCADCGIQYPYYVMQFDHVRGKSFQIGGSIGTKPLEAILQEIAKCDVVCSNCHHIRTFHRRKNDPISD